MAAHQHLLKLAFLGILLVSCEMHNCLNECKNELQKNFMEVSGRFSFVQISAVMLRDFPKHLDKSCAAASQYRTCVAGCNRYSLSRRILTLGASHWQTICGKASLKEIFENADCLSKLWRQILSPCSSLLDETTIIVVDLPFVNSTLLLWNKLGRLCSLHDRFSDCFTKSVMEHCPAVSSVFRKLIDAGRGAMFKMMEAFLESKLLPLPANCTKLRLNNMNHKTSKALRSWSLAQLVNVAPKLRGFCIITIALSFCCNFLFLTLLANSV
ncbi:hypothetical protein T01_7001 [Trichinella spiralis]|uniref:Uncharacterized protein n=1 Tax=Trichinella spiralis TaxID=6334 RepID=A0A0V1BFB6_TRISP|nr:hypothetical protein T01_7001 [Trichinella spiralis]